MKKTVTEAKQWILQVLLTGGAKNTINGQIYKDRRPSGSTKEDIVINDILLDNDFLQDGDFNVNVYVPMLSVNISGITQLQPDHNRIDAITKGIYPLLDDVWRDQFNLTITTHKTFEEQAEKANYVNFRVNLKAYN